MPIDYIVKFNKLPKEYQRLIASENAIKIIENIESTYGIEIATLLMKIIVKDVSARDLSYILQTEYSLEEEEAIEISNRLILEILAPAKGYLDLPEVREQRKEAVISDNKFLSKELDPDKFIKALIRKHELFFKDEKLLDRFKQLVLTAIKQIRTPEEFHEMLIRPEKIGGLDIDSRKADLISKDVETSIKKILKGIYYITKSTFVKSKKSIEQRKPGITDVQQKEKASKIEKPQPDTTQRVMPGSIDSDAVSKIVEDKTVTQEKVSETKLEPKAEIQSQVNKFGFTRHASSFTPAYNVIKKKQEQKKNQPIKFKVNKRVNPLDQGSWEEMESIKKKQEQKEQIVKERAQPVKEQGMDISRKTSDQIKKRPIPLMIKKEEQSDRPRMEDIKVPTKIMGPLEELESMDLKSFHQLSTDPFDATQIIKSKIDLLEDESYEKKSAGILAWKSSPLFNLYLEIGQESFNHGKSIIRVLNERDNNNKENLTVEEFNSITDLNQNLRF